MALPFSVPASLDPAFTISRPTEADVDDMARVYFESFATDPLTTYWWSSDRDAMFEYLHARLTARMNDPERRHFQVVDDQQEMVSFARWDIPEGYESAFGEWVGGSDGSLSGSGTDTDDAEPSVPISKQLRGADPALGQGLFDVLSQMSEKWDAKSMLGLSLLCTSPKYHRRGAAKALLAPMLRIADTVGLRCYLEATPTGQPLYEKLGFRTVDVHEFDVTALTGGRLEGITTITVMIREPQPSQGM